MNKNTIFYIVTIGVFGFLVWFFILQGQQLEEVRSLSGKVSKEVSVGTNENSGSFFGGFLLNLRYPIPTLIFQILLILLTAKVLGWVMIKLRQPTVIGEIIAGIVLGPSLLGWWFPEFSSMIFPLESLKNLQFLSQIGLILFMFIVGMELELDILKKRVSHAVVISHSSIVFPFFLGVALAYFLYNEFAPANASFLPFALFMGISMSITAFPVLARIVLERNMTKSTAGTLALVAAAADDFSAWCLLAVVIAIIKAGGISSALFTIALALIYVIFMFFVVKPMMKKLAHTYFTRETISKTIVAIIFAELFLSAYLAEIIGIHALFGAFLAGVVIPASPQFRHVLIQKIEDISLVLLLPLFFVFTGLRTQIGLLNDAHLWSVCLIIFGVAVAGKFLGSSLAARFVGQSWRDSLIIGALMNTRGLIQLVVLNIGYDLGILSPEIFTMLVLMALFTTIMTGPTIDIVDYFYNRSKKIVQSALADFRILLSFGSPRTGRRLLQLTNQLNLKKGEDLNIVALHMTPSADISIKEAQNFEREGFLQITSAAKRLGIEIQKKYMTANNVSREIVQTANNGNFDLMLVGSSRPVFSSNETGGMVRDFFQDVKCNVGVLVDKGFDRIENILLIVDHPSDIFITELGKLYLQDKKKSLSVLDNNNLVSPETIFQNFESEINKRLFVVQSPTIIEPLLRPFDLVVTSYHFWKKARQLDNSWIHFSPSVLILSNRTSSEEMRTESKRTLRFRSKKDSETDIGLDLDKR